MRGRAASKSRQTDTDCRSTLKGLSSRCDASKAEAAGPQQTRWPQGRIIRMARAKTTVRGRAPLARDSQQWMLDYLIQETGKVFHSRARIGVACREACAATT